MSHRRASCSLFVFFVAAFTLVACSASRDDAEVSASDAGDAIVTPCDPSSACTAGQSCSGGTICSACQLGRSVLFHVIEMQCSCRDSGTWACTHDDLCPPVELFTDDSCATPWPADAGSDADAISDGPPDTAGCPAIPPPETPPLEPCILPDGTTCNYGEPGDPCGWKTAVCESGEWHAAHTDPGPCCHHNCDAGEDG